MKRLVLFALTCSMILGGVAVAGEKVVEPVVIHLKEGWAAGSFGSARNSADTRQVLVCGLAAYSYPDGRTQTDVSCFARNASGVSASCYRAGAPLPLREAVMAMSDGAHVKFMWDEARVCTTLYATHSSSNEPRL
jgi:hypothetical protein